MHLLGHQSDHFERLSRILRERGAALDASDAGTGKTYVAAAVCASLGWRPLVICPKSVVSAWRSVLAGFGVRRADVVNYEKARAKSSEWFAVAGSKKRRVVRWSCGNLYDVVIFDEAHLCGGRGTIQSKLPSAVVAEGVRVLMCSATLAENPLKMQAAGHALGLYSAPADFWGWVQNFGVSKVQRFNGAYMFTATGSAREEALRRLNGELFPRCASRMRVSEIMDFPDEVRIAEAFDIGNAARDEVRQLYAELADENVLVQQLRLRQAVEAAKIDVLFDLAQGHLDEGRSVVVFCNFQATVDELSRRLGGVVIRGGQNEAERQAAIEKFQRDEAHVCVANVRAGGVGVSLHDVRGERQRVSLICPSYSAVDLVQAFGRTARVGGRSKALSYLVFAAGTLEEKICAKVRGKLRNLDLLNDADLMPEGGEKSQGKIYEK